MQSPASIALMVIASWPSWAVRTLFFAALLLLLLHDLDEYQLMQFIMALKGAQFVMGLVLAVRRHDSNARARNSL